MFQITDPQGKRITLTVDCWENHICISHTEMRSRLAEIRETIADPDFIYTSKSSNQTHLYFREYVDPRLKCQYILVAVQRRANQTRGFVQSAYPVKGLSKGGVLEWKKR
jgi:hypothetical protein